MIERKKRKESKMAFFRRKKQTVQEAPEEAHEPPVTVVLAFGESADADALAPLFSALPEYAEIAVNGDAGSIATPEDKHFSVCPDTGRYGGRYVVRADARSAFSASGAETLFGFLQHAEEDLVFYGENEKAGSREDPLARVFNGERPLPAHCAARRELASTGCKGKYAETFAPLLFAESAASISAYLADGEPAEPAGEEELLSLVSYFNGVKPALAAERYRFAFRHITEELLKYYAREAINGQSERLRALDESLKKENMALWVAAAENSPLGFVKTLRKRGYCLPFYLKAALRVHGVLKK